MDFYTLASAVVTLAILIAFFNHLFIRMQATIAIMVSSMVMSLLFILSSKMGFYNFIPLMRVLANINFGKLFIDGMLGFLLFAGALTVNVHMLKAQCWEILTLASFSTVASTFLVGIAIHYLLPYLGIHLPFIYSMLFGALISPTDPIAVLATFKQLRVSSMLETTVAGESLFNDGVGIVLFLTLYHLAFTHVPVTPFSVSMLFLRQALGGIVYGLAVGFLGSWLIKHTDDHKLEILLTLAVASGGYTLAQVLNISGPLAMVVAGIVIGSYARTRTMSVQAQDVLDEVWELIDEVLNCVLFLLIGFELLLVPSAHYVVTALLVIPLVLAVRFITVAIPMRIFKVSRNYCPYMITILVWGGLRGGLAVALALALPATSEYRELILAITYAVVAFAVVVQGLTIQPLVKLSNRRAASPLSVRHNGP